MSEGNAGVNELIGAIVSTVLVGVLPFAPIVGGAVAGYLQGGDRSAGVRVGLYSGVIALIPAFLVSLFVGALFLSFVGFGGLPAIGGLGILIAFVVFTFVAVYTVGFSVLGGWLGNYVKHDTDVGGSPTAAGEK